MQSQGTQSFIEISLPVPQQARRSMSPKFIDLYSLSIFIFLKPRVVFPPEDVINALLPFGHVNPVL